MQFPDKLTIHNEPERFATGEPTERFEMVSETTLEMEALRASLANVALIAMQSETVLDSLDARLIIDFLRLDNFQRSRLTVWPNQAKRIARLMERGGSSVSADIIKNQFNKLETMKAAHLSDEELVQEAMGIAKSTRIEIDARRFRKELNTAVEDDFFGPEA